MSRAPKFGLQGGILAVTVAAFFGFSIPASTLGLSAAAGEPVDFVSQYNFELAILLTLIAIPIVLFVFWRFKIGR